MEKSNCGLCKTTFNKGCAKIVLIRQKILDKKYNYSTNLFYFDNVQWLEYLEELHVKDAPKKHAHLQRRVANMQKVQSEAFVVRGQLFADARIKTSIKN